MAKAPKNAKAPKHANEPKPEKRPKRVFAIGDLLRGLSAPQLCYGEPVSVDGRTVIPVARVRAAGGGGFGDNSGESTPGAGGGGGGWVDASPVGFIEVTADGSHFVEIPDPDRTARLLRAAATAMTTMVGAAVGARALSRARRRPVGLLGRGD